MSIYIWHFLLYGISLGAIPDGFLLAFLTIAGFGARSAGEVEEEGGLDAAVDGHDCCCCDFVVGIVVGIVLYCVVGLAYSTLL